MALEREGLDVRLGVDGRTPMCAPAENLSLGALLTQAVLVPLETMSEKITDLLSQATWLMGLERLVVAKPSVSPVPL